MPTEAREGGWRFFSAFSDNFPRTAKKSRIRWVEGGSRGRDPKLTANAYHASDGGGDGSDCKQLQSEFWVCLAQTDPGVGS